MVDAEVDAHPGPRITVHVPCFNYARFLRDALDSLLGQTYDAWEAIVTDDASTDGTPEVIADYDDPRIKVVRHSMNRGLLPSCNEAIDLATGEFFVILSADDRYKPRFLERVISCFDEHPEVAFVTTHGDRIDVHGRVCATEVAPFDCTGVYDAFPLLLTRTFVAASAGVTRTTTLRRLAGYDTALRHSADAYLWRQLAIEGSIGYLQERLYERRFHAGSMSTTARRAHVLEVEHSNQLHRIFQRGDLPPAVRALEGRAFAELHWKIAHAYHGERRQVRAVSHAVRAVRFDVRVLWRHSPVRRLRRRFARAEPSADENVFVHETARCESGDVGAGTKIWAFAHVMEGASIGASCKVGGHVFVESGAVIGDRVTLKNGTLVWDGVIIEDEVFVGPGVVFTNDLVPRAHTKKRPDELLRTRIGHGASLGANATIVCGTHVGAHSMVGAGSVVTRDVPAHGLVVGNPAARVGWVCVCGGRLDGAEPLACECGRRYQSSAAGLELCSQDA